MTMFTDFGNWTTVLRIWDWVLLTGRSGLVHMSVAVLKCCASDLETMTRFEMAVPYLLNVPHDKIEPFKLFSIAKTIELSQLASQALNSPVSPAYIQKALRGRQSAQYVE